MTDLFKTLTQRTVGLAAKTNNRKRRLGDSFLQMQLKRINRWGRPIIYAYR